MVSEDSSVDPSNVHPFTVSDTVNSQTHLEDYNYGRSVNSFPQSFDLDTLSSIQLLGQRISRSLDLVQDPTLTEDSGTCDRKHLKDFLGVAKETDNQCHRLSQTLGSHLPSTTRVASFLRSTGSVGFRLPNLMGSGFSVAREEAGDTYLPVWERTRENYPFVDSLSALTSTSASPYQSCSTNGSEPFPNVVGCSTYLKPARSLLEEIVDVGAEDAEFSSDQSFRWLTRKFRRGTRGFYTELQGTAHELHIRIAKLIALLDEVDDRYEQYIHRMKEVVLSFEVIAGTGAARSYTALARQAMSRHFSSLRNTIVIQINLAKRELQQDVPEIHTGLSRVNLSNHERRLNGECLKQLRVIQNQHQAWRSIRGLPEKSVAILRSWLFEHFLHPYPKDPEKFLLASQTGLTKNQVSNWFINARVRLWKPMIEEIYKEEFTESCITASSENSFTTQKGVRHHVG